jgi:hypothetical protein
MESRQCKTYRVRLTTPSEGQKKTYNARNQEEGANKIELLQLLHQREVCCRLISQVEEWDDDEQGGATQRQVQIETPSPSHIRGECATDQRAGYGSDTEDGTEDALDLWTVLERNDLNNADNLIVRPIHTSVDCKP